MTVRGAGFVSLTLVFFSPAHAEEFLAETTPKIFEAQGASQPELLQKAESCLLRIVRYDEVITTGTGTGMAGLFSGPEGVRENSVGVAGGDVIRFKNAVEGVIYANNRLDFKANLLAHSLQSVIDFAAKDGKFKIVHRDIAYLQKDSGFGTPDGYKPLRAKDTWGSNLTANSMKALDELTEKIADCVRAAPDNSW